MAKIKKEKLFKTLKPLFSAKDIEHSIITEEQKKEAIQLWQKKFIPKKLNKNESLWHTFSFDLYPHIVGDAAINQFDKLFFKNFNIFSNYDYHAIAYSSLYSKNIEYKKVSQLLKQLPNHVDIFISQNNFKWTFVIPHEEDFGPYFATNPLKD